MLRKLGIILFIVGIFVLTALLFGYQVAGTEQTASANFDEGLPGEDSVR